MKVAVTDLVAAVAAINLVPSRAGISSSEFIRIRAGGTRLRLSLAAEIYGTTFAKCEEAAETSWEFFVDRASFVPFILAAKELGQKTPFEFKISEKNGRTLTVRCGARRAMYQTVTEISGYSDKSDFKGVDLRLSKEQKIVLRLAAKYATPDPTVAHLNCIYLSKGKAVMASNQLSAFYMADKAAPMSVPLPLLLLSIIDSDHVKSITVANRFAKIDLDCGFLCQLTNQKAAEEFPHKAIAKSIVDGGSYKQRMVLKGSALVAVLKRIETYIASVVKRDMVVSVTGKKGEARIKLSAAVPQGSFDEFVKLAKPLPADVECQWLLALLLPLSEIAGALGSVAVRYNDLSPFLFSSKGMQLLVARKA